jgi:hypothetical protein
MVMKSPWADTGKNALQGPAAGPQRSGGPPPASPQMYSLSSGGGDEQQEPDYGQPSPPPQRQQPYQQPYQSPPFAQQQPQQPQPPPQPPPQMQQQTPEDQRVIVPEIYDPGDIGRSGYAKGTGPARDWYGMDYTTGKSAQQVGLPPMPPNPDQFGPPNSPGYTQAAQQQHAWINEGIRRGLTLADMGFQPAVGAGLALYKAYAQDSGATWNQLQAEGPGAYGGQGPGAPGGPGGPGGGGPPNTSVIPNQQTPGGNAPGGGGNQVAPVFGGDSNSLIAQLLPFLLGSQGSSIKPGGYGSGVLADTYAPEYGLQGTQGNLMLQMMQMLQNRQGGGNVSPYFTPEGTIGAAESSTPSTYTYSGG